ncbi:uncharacterized protein LY89DRAFT_688845 [Mollisia scopiformis]|uniref:Uncharacterized protein n=1 Tax=Mollisia scopiformis TaxID=149040 RepID=A0A194WUM7_MOLSC|nr:uncharacterized protein LY89DRAFT_688845 [Mollisia scopiformis]KUJ11668.1 hypothetical protein LY89DRAFT_688845 [Mollisia scopiformis]
MFETVTAARPSTWTNGFFRRLMLHFKNGFSHIKNVCQVTLRLGWSPWHASRITFRHILRTTSSERGAVIERFIAVKQRELDTVAVASALVASVVASLLSWSWFPVPPYTAKIALLCALVHSLLAVGIAGQQSIALGRASLHSGHWAFFMPTISGRARYFDESEITDASRLQCFAWQIPSMLVGNSIIFILVGIAISVFSAARKAGCWGDEVVTAICLTISLLFGLGSYFISWMSIEWKILEEIEHDTKIPDSKA